MSRCAAVALTLLLGVRAGAAWAQTASDFIGIDAGIRDDLQLLADRAQVAAPLGSWPLPLAELSRIVDAVPASARQDAAVAAAVQRLERVRERHGQRGWRSDLRVAAGDPGRLRGSGDELREHGELAVSEIYASGRWTANLTVTTAPGASDGQDTRLDGSHVTMSAGNWLLSANSISRLWGPSGESSLILSDNARPVPALSLTRASAAAAANRYAHWIGPWNLSAFIGQLENGRRDVSKPLFAGMRVSAQPLPGLDLGLSRTMQLCGTGRNCGPNVLWNALIGRDNVGPTGNVSAADQPGNQLAGWDARLRSPWKSLPLAYYEQQIGEDGSGIHTTSRLALRGLETWWAFDSGASLRAFVEYADTVCAANSPRPLFNCAYTNTVFDVEGYRYRGRALGHTADADSLLRVAGLRFHDAADRSWGLRYRTGTLNRDGGFDPNHSTSHGASYFKSLDASLRAALFGFDVQAQLGAERQTPRGGVADSSLFGFVSVQRQLH